MLRFCSEFACLAACFIFSAAGFAAEKTITANIKSVDAARNTITFGDLTLAVTRKSKITLDGKTATLTDVKEGQSATVKYNDQLQAAISIVVGTEATIRVAGATTIRGKIVSIDRSERLILVAIEGNTKEKPREFEIGRKVRISLDGAPAGIRDIEVRQSIELEVVTDLEIVTTLKAKSVELTFVPLFDGKTLEGWNGDRELWKVSNGVMIGSGPKLPEGFRSYLSTNKTFSNFVLKARFKSSAHDSGVVFRGKKNVQFGLQTLTGAWEFGNLIDENENGHVRVLGNVDERTRLAIAGALKKDGWSDLKVTAIGAHFTVHLNGVRTVDVEHPGGPKVGYLSLKLRDFTQLEIKEIEIAELPEN